MSSEILKSNLRHMRKQHRLTVTEAAIRFDTRRGTYSAWEEGRSHPPAKKLIAIADYYGITVDELLRVDLTMTYAVHWRPEIVRRKQ